MKIKPCWIWKKYVDSTFPSFMYVVQNKICVKESLKYEKYLLEYHLLSWKFKALKKKLLHKRLADPMTARMDRNQKYIMEK